MAYDHAATKIRRHRAIHDTFAIAATYFDDSLAAPVELRVRWHNKMALHGDINKEGNSQYVDSIDRVIFDIPELLLKGVQVVRGGVIVITARGHNNQKLFVDTQDDTAGPGEEIWLVGKG